MSIAYLAQPEQQQQLEWLDGGTLALLLDGAATAGQLMIGRFDVSRGEAPPYHLHTREDEVFLLIKGTALVWVDDEEMELSEGGIVFLPKNVPHAYRITSEKADLLMINTPAGIEGMFRETGQGHGDAPPAGLRGDTRPGGLRAVRQRRRRAAALTTLAPTAEVLEDPERGRILDRQAARYAGFPAYRDRASRAIPVVTHHLQEEEPHVP